MDSHTEQLVTAGEKLAEELGKQGAAFLAAHPEARRQWTGKGFVCPVCGKKVGWRGGLGQHLRWHAQRGDIEAVHLPVASIETYYILPNGKSERH